MGRQVYIPRSILVICPRLTSFGPVVELGAGCALPSLLSSTLPNPPALAVITDYPDPIIIGNLTANVERNRPHYNDTCSVYATGYEWGRDVDYLL